MHAGGTACLRCKATLCCPPQMDTCCDHTRRLSHHFTRRINRSPSRSLQIRVLCAESFNSSETARSEATNRGHVSGRAALASRKASRTTRRPSGLHVRWAIEASDARSAASPSLPAFAARRRQRPTARAPCRLMLSSHGSRPSLSAAKQKSLYVNLFLLRLESCAGLPPTACRWPQAGLMPGPSPEAALCSTAAVLLSSLSSRAHPAWQQGRPPPCSADYRACLFFFFFTSRSTTSVSESPQGAQAPNSPCLRPPGSSSGAEGCAHALRSRSSGADSKSTDCAPCTGTVTRHEHHSRRRRRRRRCLPP